MNEIRNELVTATTVSMKEIADPSAFKVIKQRFMDEAVKLVESNLPTLNPSMKEFLIGKLMQDMLGLGEIEFLVNDPNLEEKMFFWAINSLMADGIIGLSTY